MINEILKLVQQHGQSAVVNNPQVPNEHNEAVMNEANQSILSGLQKAMSAGGISKVTEILSGGGLAGNITGNFAGNIAQKFGIDAASAQKVAGNLIPGILGSLGSKVQSGNFNLQEILGPVSANGGIQDTLSNAGAKMGLDKDGDGDVDLGDITKLFGR